MQKEKEINYELRASENRDEHRKEKSLQLVCGASRSIY